MSTAAAPVMSSSGNAATKSASRKVASHPPYSEMIKASILALKERKGSSRQAIKKYILANFKLDQDEKRVSTAINAALKKGTESGTFLRPSGPSGTVKLAKPEKSAEKKESKKKPLASKSDTAQKAKTKKSAIDKKKITKKLSTAKSASKKTKAAKKSADAPKKKAVPSKKAVAKKASPKKTAEKKKSSKKV